MSICEMLKMVKWYQHYLHISERERDRGAMSMWNAENGETVSALSPYFWEREREIVGLCPYVKHWKWWNGISTISIFPRERERHYVHTRFHIYQYEIAVMQCSGVAVIYAQKLGGPSTLGICTFCSMWNFFSVVVWHASMIDWRGVHLPQVYAHSSLCETYLV